MRTAIHITTTATAGMIAPMAVGMDMAMIGAMVAGIGTADSPQLLHNLALRPQNSVFAALFSECLS